MNEGIVYLIHFARPVGDLDNPRGQARHYLGWAQDVEARLDAHAAGNSARLMQVVTEAGIGWQLARTWPGSQEIERRLKRQHNAPRLCPFCNPEGWQRRGTDP